MSSIICGQRRSRSACASAQSDQDLHCPLSESLDTTECMNGEQKLILCACAGWSEFAHFAYNWRHAQDDLCIWSKAVFNLTRLIYTIYSAGGLSYIQITKVRPRSAVIPIKKKKKITTTTFPGRRNVIGHQGHRSPLIKWLDTVYHIDEQRRTLLCVCIYWRRAMWICVCDVYMRGQWMSKPRGHKHCFHAQ